MIQPGVSWDQQKIVEAQYDKTAGSDEEPVLPQYQHNPLILALPLMMKEALFTKSIFKPVPQFSQQCREASALTRKAGVAMLSAFFLPQRPHYQLYHLIDRVMKMGYQTNLLRNTTQYNLQNATIPFIGPRGVGKYTAIFNTLRLYDVISHDLMRYPVLECPLQIPAFILPAPDDGKLDALKLSALERLSQLLKGQFEVWVNKNDPLHRILSPFRVGVLAIDKWEVLLNLKLKEQVTIINHIFSLVSKLRTTLLIIGTPDIYRLFEKAKYPDLLSGMNRTVWLPQLAEAKGQEGYRLAKEFTQFVQTIWPYQWIKDPVSKPTPDILQAFYYCTAGIRGHFIRLFQAVQIRLMEDYEKGICNEESITPEVIYSVAEQSFHNMNAEIGLIVKHPRNLKLIDRMGGKNLPEIDPLAELFDQNSGTEVTEESSGEPKPKRQTRQQTLKEILITGFKIAPDKAEALSRCAVCQLPTGSIASQGHIALRLNEDPAFDKKQAPWIERMKLNIPEGFAINKFRLAQKQPGEACSTYDKLKAAGLTTNLRDLT